MKRFIDIAIRIFPALLLVALVAIPAANGAWTEDEFERRPLYAYPLPHGKDDIIGNLITYKSQRATPCPTSGDGSGGRPREFRTQMEESTGGGPRPAGKSFCPTSTSCPIHRTSESC